MRLVVQVLFLAIIGAAGLLAGRGLLRAGALRRTRMPAGPRGPRVFLSDVALLLHRVEEPHSLRGEPAGSDLRGEFTAWFDGGALRRDGDAVRYAFADGGGATVTTRGLLHADLTLPLGTTIRVQEERLDLSHLRSFTRLVTALEGASTMPRLRLKPESRDPPGDYTAWFDGGTVLADLHGRTIALAEGATIRILESDRLLATVDLPGGQRFRVEEAG